MKNPRYSYPLAGLPGLVFDLLTGRHRSSHADALRCINRLDPPLQVWGAGNIPASGPCLLAVNHYHRPGFGAWWIALAIAASVPVDMHWVITGELTFPGKWYAFIGRPFSRWLLGRVARMYGFTAMPPMPPRPQDVAVRARAVRAVLEHVRRQPGAILSISPEGTDAPGGVLAWPPPGAGRFLLLLADRGFPILPVGCWEQDGSLCVRFGQAYLLKVPSRLQWHKKDHQAAGIVMRCIANQLPRHLRGDFL